jgi:hypothetical protein
MRSNFCFELVFTPWFIAFWGHECIHARHDSQCSSNIILSLDIFIFSTGHTLIHFLHLREPLETLHKDIKA